MKALKLPQEVKSPANRKEDEALERLRSGIPVRKKVVLDLPSGASGSLLELSKKKLTAEDVEAAKDIPEAMKARIRMQYMLDKAKEEDESLPKGSAKRHREYTI
jgi:hypothetical protein